MQKVLKEIHNSSSILVFNRRKWKGHWWPSWTSNPVGGVSNVSGGFDSHALPPFFKSCQQSAFSDQLKENGDLYYN